MIGLIIIIIIGLFLAYSVSYLVLYIPIRLLFKNDRFKKLRLILPFIGALFILSFYTFVSPKRNYETATIQRVQNNYLLTLRGDRLLMVHDPISALMRKTYVDTLKLLIPRQNGKIDGNEIKIEQGYKVIGTLHIKENNLKVDLYFDNSDVKKKEPLTWNDNYKVHRINK